MSTIYCVKADIEAILGVAGVLALIDDDQDGEASAAELLHVTAAIERAAVEMNTAIENSDYDYADLTSNDWCKQCNATLAAYKLSGRKNNTPSATVVEEYQHFKNCLEELRWGRFRIPEQAPSHETKPTVSNFRPEVNKNHSPIRVVTEESTGSSPADGIKREQAYQPGIW